MPTLLLLSNFLKVFWQEFHHEPQGTRSEPWLSPKDRQPGVELLHRGQSIDPSTRRGDRKNMRLSAKHAGKAAELAVNRSIGLPFERNKMNFKRSDFPANFAFGAATAAYQIEGHQFGGAGPTHWDTFAATPGNVVRAEDGALACDHYHRFGEDLDLLKDAGLDAYRFSTSWARVMPDGRTPNPEGLDFYDRLVDGMLERGLKPFQTLYHWELPSALADKGGWANRDTTSYFGDFTDVITDRIGDRMEAIATINEHRAYVIYAPPHGRCTTSTSLTAKLCHACAQRV